MPFVMWVVGWKSHSVWAKSNKASVIVFFLLFFRYCCHFPRKGSRMQEEITFLRPTWHFVFFGAAALSQFFPCLLFLFHHKHFSQENQKPNTILGLKPKVKVFYEIAKTFVFFPHSKDCRNKCVSTFCTVNGAAI